MIKKLLIFTLLVVSFTVAFAQPVFYNKAPNGVTTTQVRAPNGLSTYAYLRSTSLVLANELSALVSGSTISAFGYTLSAGTDVPTTGNFTVYIQNTTDVTYSKGTNWPTIISGMTTVYASTMTVPASAGTTSVAVTLSTPFVYTGGGIYVAIDWYSPGPYASTPATYYAEGSTLVPGTASANSASVAPTTLGTSAFRPDFLFGVLNPNANDMNVMAVEAPGKVAGMFNTGHTITSVVRNSSNQSLTNVPVTLNVTGANSFSNTQTIGNIAAGATTTVSFASFNPVLPGINTLSVSVPNDNVNSNNSSTYTQSVTCNEWALNPPIGTYTAGVGFNTGSGIIAVNYPNPVASSLVGIRVAISSPTTSIGNSVWGALLNSTGAILATTNTVAITAGNVGTQQTFTFSTPQSLTASSNYYIGLAQPANTTLGYFPIGSIANAYAPYMNYVTTTTVGGTPAPLTSSLGYFDIEAIHSAPQITVNSGTICTGQSFTMVPSGAISYSYSSGSSIVSPVSNTNYTVTGLGYGGCVSNALSDVIVNSLPSVTVNSGAICTGQSFTMTPSGASTYTYSNGTDIVTPTSNDSYTVTGTDGNGCSNTAVSSVTVNPLPAISVNSGTICAGQSFTMVPTGAVTYTYSNGSSVSTPTANGTYTVTGTDGNGCENTVVSTVTVNSLPSLMATTNNTLLCTGETSTLSVMGASTYTWSTAENTTDIVVSPTVQTTYTVDGTDANGCINSTTVTQDVSLCTGITSLVKDASNNVYPNPNNGSFVIELTTLSKVTVTNALGQVIISEMYESGKHDINIQEEKVGIYFVKITNNNKQQIIKVIKQ